MRRSGAPHRARQFCAAVFPQPSPVGAALGEHNSRGEGECRERPRETFLVALPSSGDRALSCADRGLAFFFAKIDRWHARGEPSAWRGIIASKQQKVLRVTLACAPAGAKFFATGGNRFPIGAFSACGTGLSPHPHPLKVRPPEPRRNCTGALRYRAPLTERCVMDLPLALAKRKAVVISSTCRNEKPRPRRPGL
jgi:hypothetical protein